jgi:Outer membrane protein beta-barrel domain
MHPLRSTTTALLAGTLLACAAAQADEDGFYLGGALGGAQQNYDASTFDAHGSQTGYKFELGFRPIDLFAAEVSYIDFGRAFSGINYADTDALGVFALGYLPIPVVDVFGKVGLADWRTDAQSPFLGFHRTGADLAYGLGAGTSWGKFAVRLEYERYEVSHSNDMGMASVGLTWTFL